MCHSDEALRIGEAPFDFPGILGHEGAGVVEEVGPGVTDLKRRSSFINTCTLRSLQCMLKWKSNNM